MKRVALSFGLVVVPVLAWASGAEAACSGSGQAWSCEPGSGVADVQSALDAATDGAIVTFAAGAYSWDDMIRFAPDRGVTLACSAEGACDVAVTTGTILALNGDLSGTNDSLYRITGFAFHDAPDGALAIWFWGPGTLSKVRVDHNTFADFGESAIAIAFGESTTVGAYYGVLDHNVVTGPHNFLLLHVFGGMNDTPPASPRGKVENMFVEDNTMSFTAITNTGVGCADSWGGASVVWRHNTTTNCLVTSHGVVHAGGPLNYELYANSFHVDSGATGSEDCYRCFHHQGSAELTAFDNEFTAGSGKTGTAISMTHYRSADPVEAGYGDPPGRCDGTQPIDGNRAPAATYHGYPCWRQPGRDGAGNLRPMYVWNNRWSDTGDKIDMTVENPWGATSPSVDDHVANDRDYYNAVSASAQTSPTSPFDGTTGMGFGTLANRPPTCTTNLLEEGGGVGYFATDDGPDGTLYRCSATNTWTVEYKPYPYPHPLAGGPSPGTGGAGGTGVGGGEGAGSGTGGAGTGAGGSGASAMGGASADASDGCGCAVPGDGARGAYGWVSGAIALGLLGRRRRRIVRTAIA